MGRHIKRQSSVDLLFWITTAFLILVFATGGASRADALSLLVLRPAAVVALAFGLWRINRQTISNYRFHYLIAALTLVLIVAHLIPLPPSIWRSLSGRELAIEVDNVAGLVDVWRPLTLVFSCPFRLSW